MCGDHFAGGTRMEVRLLKYTPDPELTVAAAARLCYSDLSGEQLVARMTSEQAERLLRRVIGSGHHSILEHASFTFAIDGLSRAASHQLVRHRLASYSQQSQRYVSLRQPQFVVPPSVARDPAALVAFEQAAQVCFSAYRQLQDLGIPVEDARYILPNATGTRLMMTMNARELIHVSSLRLCNRAQWEIVALFEKVRDEVKAVAPLIGSYLRPKCEALGYCDEAESCGRTPPRPD